MKLIYIGNRASEIGKTPSVQDELTPLFAEAYDVISVSNKSNILLRLLHMLGTLVRYGRKADYVLIDTFSTLNFYYAYLCGMYCKLFNIPFALFLHGGDLPLRVVKSPFISKQLFSAATKLISPSEYLRSSFLKLGYQPVLIPNIVNIKNYHYKVREIDSVDLLWVRNFREHYNPILAVNVLAKLSDLSIPTSLKMVGPGGIDSSLESCRARAVELHIADKVDFTGMMTKAQWIELSKSCNVFINTTNVDNTPVSVIEAMALGLPVVSTNVGGIPFLLEDGVDALLVEPNDQEAMCRAIERLKSDPELVKQLTLNARKKVENFDWEVVKHKWKKLFDELSV